LLYIEARQCYQGPRPPDKTIERTENWCKKHGWKAENSQGAGRGKEGSKKVGKGGEAKGAERERNREEWGHLLSSSH